MQNGTISIGEATEARVMQNRPEGKEFTYVDIGSVDRETKRIVDAKTLPTSKTPSRARQHLKTGDVLVSMTRPNLNAVALVPPDLDGAIGSTGFHVLRARDAEPGFLFYAVQSPNFINAMCQKVQGALYPAVRPKDISSFCLPNFSLDAQRATVAEIEKQFTRLEAGVAALRRVQANLKRYRAAVLKAACEGKLVPTEAEFQKSAGTVNKEFESGEQLLKRILAERRQNWTGRGKYKESAVPESANLSVLPEGWTWGTLDGIAAIKGGITKDQNRKFTESARSIPYLRVANVQRGYLDLSEIKEITTTEDEIQELRLDRGDILFNEGGDRDKLGRGWIWNGELPECIHQNHVFRARLHVPEMNPKFVSWYANTFGQKFFFDQGKHTTNLASISMAKLKNLPVPVPPPAEQARIVPEVERHLSVIHQLETAARASLQRATRLRQAVLQVAFQGLLVSDQKRVL